ncbi:hypothetical protein K443DRAFT_574254 [Laccaria amethystina LaAM-08-1]|uniref:Uncharacterized protein n=1 Tax=Laccaria amethystina LaAM-08-1 TaxID=1095629 RepID=A0A0C9XIB8_9AGAR|nr:hypothetical protein K443DRAFT_574254 [Laccaria amethystina LaAM-08-1]
MSFIVRLALLDESVQLPLSGHTQSLAEGRSVLSMILRLCDTQDSCSIQLSKLLINSFYNDRVFLLLSRLFFLIPRHRDIPPVASKDYFSSK